MSIRIKEVQSKHDLETFIKFPMNLYKDNQYYVPPFINEEKETLDVSKNPVFKDAEARYFLAEKEGKIVGRVAAIINWQEVNKQQKRKMRFGWFDMIDDIEVTKALLAKVEEIGKENKLEYVEGPVGFSNLEKAGMLTMGFDKLATMVGLYNYAYYPQHLESLGFETANEWVEYELPAPKVLPEKVTKFNTIIRERYKLRELKFTKTSEIIPFVDEMFDLLDKTYSELDTYVPIADYQIEYYKKKYIPFINPDFVNCIVDENNKMIAFAITMPSYSKAMQRAKGKIFPFGWWHLMRASKNNDSAQFYLIGIDPKFQGKGVTALIFSAMFDTFNRNNIEFLETNPELADNESIQVLWKAYSPVNHKARKTYRKSIQLNKT
ncbi:GTP cyclohydrolase [Empedobacter tilapiae]|uniref:GTP cyclohydrolase n=1 Tax=Empedobacter tilapiae TaxID=2491114 RepID=A0A4Z1BQ06_9FLAO|nr:GTP cyclohydrolase [Empedobacter tilapiae]TGN27850.1 GTP cyclohydrolase [Empedobacter tilapiae]